MVGRLILIACLFVNVFSNIAVACAAKPPAPLAVIALSPYPVGTYQMTLRATVRGQEGTFLFDTGGGVSYLSPAFAQRIGGKPWGQITGFMMSGERLDMPRCDDIPFAVAGQNFPLPITGVFDITAFLPSTAPKIDGAIALDLFAGHAVTLQWAQHTLIVESPRSLADRIKRGKSVPIRLVRDAEGVALTVVVAVPTSSGLAWMEIDSGNGGAFVIGKHIAALLKLDAEKKGPQDVRFDLAGGIPVEGQARIMDKMIMDGNIGTRFLIHWDLTLDLAKGRAWLAPAREN